MHPAQAPPPIPHRQSLVAQTIAVLREQIRTGAWAPRLPSERELCETLCISRVTLRAALAEVERERLVRVVHGRHREVVRRKRAVLPASSSTNVVLLTPGPLHTLPPFVMYWVDHLRGHLGDAGYHLQVHIHQGARGVSGNSSLPEVAQRLRPAGWVLYRSTAPVQQWFSKIGVPCVITGSRHGGVVLPSVDLDHRALCRCCLMYNGLKLPQDVALISRNHDSFLEEVVPSLARYSCDPALFARRISRMVLQLVQGGAGQPRQVLVMPDFVPGQSLG
jgi:DNA-binding LacI/PurR family transcriptional regulator